MKKFELQAAAGGAATSTVKESKLIPCEPTP